MKEHSYFKSDILQTMLAVTCLIRSCSLDPATNYEFHFLNSLQGLVNILMYNTQFFLRLVKMTNFQFIVESGEQKQIGEKLKKVRDLVDKSKNKQCGASQCIFILHLKMLHNS